MRLILLGPPGCGKGTQASSLARFLKAPTVSTGDLFRAAVREGTQLGKQAAGFMNRGELVPDELTIGLLKERIVHSDCAAGFLLDGFPRTLAQAEALQGMLREMALALDAVVDIQLEDEVIVQRLSGRRVCEQCGRTYHVVASPPKMDGKCDECGGTLIHRIDDQSETIRHRLNVYRRQTEPLIDYYRDQGLLKVVDGHGSVENIQTEIRTGLNL